MDPSEPDGITSPATPNPNQAPNSGPPGAITKARLQSLEQNLLVLERNYGGTHPQVCPSLLCYNNIWCQSALAKPEGAVALMQDRCHSRWARKGYYHIRLVRRFCLACSPSIWVWCTKSLPVTCWPCVMTCKGLHHHQCQCCVI